MSTSAEEDVDVSDLSRYTTNVEELYLRFPDSSLRSVLLALNPRYCEDDPLYPCSKI